MSRRLRSALASKTPSATGSVVAAHREAPPGTSAAMGSIPAMPGPLVLDLVAALLQGGAPPRSALQSVGAALQAVADPSGEDLLQVSARVGHPVIGVAARREGVPSAPPPTFGAGLVTRWLRALRERARRDERGSEDRSWGGKNRETARTRPRAGRAGRDPRRLTIVLEEALWLAARSGLPPTTLIRRAAADERRRQSAAQSRAVRRLEVLLVVPAGLCLLPAFVLLGVAPVVLDLVLG
jgi:hypothetical protein